MLACLKTRSQGGKRRWFRCSPPSELSQLHETISLETPPEPPDPHAASSASLPLTRRFTFLQLSRKRMVSMAGSRTSGLWDGREGPRDTDGLFVLVSESRQS